MRVVVGSWLALVALVVGPLLVGRPRTLRRVNPVLDAHSPADPPVRVALTCSLRWGPGLRAA